MKTKLLVTVSALILSGSMAFAQASDPAPTPAETQITALQAEGFKRFEVKVGLTQTKIEAIDVANVSGKETPWLSADGVPG